MAPEPAAACREAVGVPFVAYLEVRGLFFVKHLQLYLLTNYVLSDYSWGICSWVTCRIYNWDESICLYICVYMQVLNIYIYIYICMSIYIYMSIYICLYIYICICVYIYIALYLLVYVYTEGRVGGDSLDEAAHACVLQLRGFRRSQDDTQLCSDFTR